ncbi:response regulator transcription factor [Psychromicrobium lacuslunae]|uniref:Transcriptional regulator n=1 Tax=Psychromicrobium lacuslunae TaxID=1618207 RepID=A0A0D4C0W4_9MICC|nr:response regulator transcription factor [Psychromicrobium lacuslunae]AJT42233.1 transcriptional regulator [Psychromicrobium lacuslunae]
MAKILIVEDSPEINAAFRLALSQRGHSVEGVFLGAEGVAKAIGGNPPELVILDLMLPDIDGLQVCRLIRQSSQLPIIMMTARGDDVDVILGLEAGADDYVVKPVEPAILEARIRAVLRRGAVEKNENEPDVVLSHSLRIDRDALQVSKDGAELALSPTEIRLLLELSRYPGQVRSREQLLQAVWGVEYLLESRMVDASIQRLRSKIEDDPAHPQIVVTVRGFGYRFDQQK